MVAAVPDVPTKECSNCGAAKLIAAFGVCHDKRRPKSDGRRGVCRVCFRSIPSRSRSYRQEAKRQAAVRQGKEYRPLDQYRRHLEEQRHQRVEKNRRTHAAEREERRQRCSVALEEQLRVAWRPDLHVPGMDETRARKKVANGLLLGRIVKPKCCSRCGAVPPRHRLHGHHEDYEYPLRVEWLCAACHSECHGRTC